MGLFDNIGGKKNDNPKVVRPEGNKETNKLRKDLDSQKEANVRLIEELGDQRTQVEELKKLLNSANARIAAQEKIIKDNDKKDNGIPDQKTIDDAVAAAVKKEQEKAEREKQALQKELSEVQNLVFEADAELEENKNSIKELQGALSDKDNKIGELEKELNKAVQELKALDADVAQQKVQLDLKRKELESREQRLKENEGAQENIEAAIVKEKLELQDQKKRLNLLESQLNKSRELVEKLEKKLAVKETELLDNEKQLNVKAQELNSKEVNLENELNKLRAEAEADIAAKKEEAAEAVKKLQEDTLKEIADKRGKAENELVSWKEKEISALTGAYNALRVAFDQDLADKRKNMFEEMSIAVNQEKDYRLKELTEEINDKRSTLAKEKQELKTLKEKLEQDRDNLVKEQQDLEVKQKELDWEKQRLEKKQASLDARSNSIEQEVLNTYHSVIDGYKNDLENLNNELVKVTESYNAVMEDLRAYDDISSMFPEQSGKMLEARLAELEKTKIKLEAEIAARPEIGLRDELANMKTAYLKLQQGSVNTKDRIVELEAEHSNFNVLKAERDRLNYELECAKVELETARNKILYLEGEVKRLSSSEAMVEEYEKRLKDIRQDLEELKDAKNPVDENGKPILEGQPTDEIAWLNEISKNCYNYGIAFPKRILYAFHTALKIADWSTVTVLAGVSGTGKSELPHLYCEMGRLNFINVPVQPNWDSQESMLGYYNSIDNKFDAQPALRFLVECTEKLDQCMSIVLLDEMNLAHVEYYFAEFLSKLELRRGAKKGEEPSVEVKLGAGVPPYQLKLKRNILWCGTMNQDETTKSLSDKVLDRGIVINFPRPKNLKGRAKMTNLSVMKKNNKISEKPMLSYETWKNWRITDIKKDKDGNPGFKEEQLAELARLRVVVEEINNCLGNVGRALGHRVWQSIEFYIANYPEVIAAKKNSAGALTSELKNAMHIAFEDQLVQKVMPKLRGIDTRGTSKEKCLDPIKQILINEGFDHLEGDFERAMQLGYGQFMWCSAEFIDADDIAGISKDDKK